MFEVALIDGDNLVYNAGHAIQRTYWRFRDKHTKELIKEFPIGVTLTEIRKSHPDIVKNYKKCECKRVQPVHYAYHIIQLRMRMIMTLTLAQRYELYIGSDSKDNFRYKVATTLPYKAGRARRPLEYDAIRKYLVDQYQAQIVRGAEADDMLVKRHKELGDKSVLCSIDKDMRQSHGWHFNIDKKELQQVSEEEAKLNLVFQIIFGDKGDNIPGLKHLFEPRIGEVKVRKWIEENRDIILSKHMTVDYPDMPYWITRLPFFKSHVADSTIYTLYKEQLQLLTCGDI